MVDEQLLDALQAQNARLAAVEQTQKDSTGWCVVGGGEPSILRPILRSDGLRWCCTHSEEHCSPVIGGQP